jgi:glucose-1-phosphate thymidylyltransferase
LSLVVVIPAAGEGKRLKPHTQIKPKVMLEVAGKPIIGHIVDRIAQLNPDKVCVVVPPNDTTISDYIKANYNLCLQFIVQKKPMGLGHAILCAEEAVGNEPVLILLGDTIVDFDSSALLKEESVIGVKNVSDPRRFGVVLLKDGVIKKVIEKPSEPVSNLAIVGVYYFKNSFALYQALNRLIEENRIVGKEYQFTDALQILADQGVGIRTVDIDVWLDCGTPQALLETNRLLLARKDKQPLSDSGSKFCLQQVVERTKDSVIIPPVFIADDALIERSVIGPFVSVSARANVVESVIQDALIFQGAVVHRSVLNSSIVGEGAEVKGVSESVNLGPNSRMEKG